MAFVKAKKSQAKARIAITGPSGSGKTKTALLIAEGLGGRIAVVDSEFGSASKYASEHDFDVDELHGDNHPNRFIQALREAERAGYSVCIVDSMTHAWAATKDVVDQKKIADRNGNGFTAWAEGTKLWDALQNAIQASSMDIIVTMRSKTEYSQEVENGKKVIKKLGMAPEVRDGTEFAYDVVLDMDCDHWGRVSKTRCSSLDGYAALKPSKAFGETLRTWLSDGVAAPKLADPTKRNAIFAELKACGATNRQIAEAVGGTSPNAITTDHLAALEELLASILAEIEGDGATNPATDAEAPE